MDGVRIELTVLESGGVTARWTSIGHIPSLFVARPLLPRARRSPLLFALSENDEEEREAVEAPGGDDVGGKHRTRFSGKASRCPTNGRHPRVHGRKESNLQQRVLEARALTDRASAVER